MFLKLQFLYNTFAILLYKTNSVTTVISFVIGITFGTLKIAVAFVKPGIHVLSVDVVTIVSFLPMNDFATADATTEAVSIAVTQSYVD
jgi:molecular chaperone DnaK (HSP70)